MSPSGLRSRYMTPLSRRRRGPAHPWMCLVSLLSRLVLLRRRPPGVPTPQLSAAAAADAVRAALAAAVPLSHPLPNAELSLATDASDSHIGGVLQQKEAAGWRPLGFFSRKLTETEVKYSAFDRELLACFYPIRHFRIMLEGRHFQLWTDHKPLLAALHRVSLPWTPRQQRQLAFIAECTSDVRDVPGLANVVADHLSRPPAAPVCQVAAHHLPAAPACQVAAQLLDAVPDPPVVVDYAAMAAVPSGPARGWPPYVRPAASPSSRGTWRATLCWETSLQEFSGQ